MRILSHRSEPPTAAHPANKKTGEELFLPRSLYCSLQLHRGELAVVLDRAAAAEAVDDLAAQRVQVVRVELVELLGKEVGQDLCAGIVAVLPHAVLGLGAQELGAEGSFVGYGGITVKAPHFYGSEITMYSIWHWYSTLHRVDYPVDPDTDFVVINLGTNDSNVSNYSTEQFTADYLSMLNEMKISYPNAHFVLCYGMMGRAYGIDSGITAVVEQFDGEASYCKLPSNLEGAGSHPTVEGHRAAGKYLAQFIEGLI